jgi:hypothetical protein
MLVVECGVHGDVGYLCDVADVRGGDDLGDMSGLREVQCVLVLEDVDS